MQERYGAHRMPAPQPSELTGRAGMDYPQRYAWVMRFDERGTIVQVRSEA